MSTLDSPPELYRKQGIVSWVSGISTKSFKLGQSENTALSINSIFAKNFISLKSRQL